MVEVQFHLVLGVVLSLMDLWLCLMDQATGPMLHAITENYSL